MDDLGWKVAIMLAARAGSLRSNIDFNKPIVELKYMKLTTARVRRRFTSYYDSYKRLLQIPSSLQSADSITIYDIVHARHETALIMENISKQDGYRNKEIYLLREFLYHNLSHFHQTFVELLFDEYDLMAHDRLDQIYSVMSPLLLMCSLSSLLYVIYTIGLEAASYANLYYLTVFVIAYIFSNFAMTPTKLALKFILIDIVTFRRLYRLKHVIGTRARAILKRDVGFFMFGYSLIQHMNPACRAARTFPILSVSKFMIACNDCDIRIIMPRYQFYKLFYWGASFEKFIECLLFMLFSRIVSSVPASIQHLVIDTTFASGLLYIMHFASRSSMVNITMFIVSVSTILYLGLALASAMVNSIFTAKNDKVNEQCVLKASRFTEGLKSIVKKFKDRKSSSSVYVADKGDDDDDDDGWLTSDMLGSEEVEVKIQKDRDNGSMTTYDSTLLQEPSLELSTASSHTPTPAISRPQRADTVDTSDKREDITIDDTMEDKQAEILSRQLESSRIVLPALVKPLPPSLSGAYSKSHKKHQNQGGLKRSFRERSGESHRTSRRSSRRGRRDDSRDDKDFYRSGEERFGDLEDIDAHGSRQGIRSSRRRSSRGYERTSSREMRRHTSRVSAHHSNHSKSDDVYIQDMRNFESVTDENEIDSKLLSAVQNLSVSEIDNKGGNAVIPDSLTDHPSTSTNKDEPSNNIETDYSKEHLEGPTTRLSGIRNSSDEDDVNDRDLQTSIKTSHNDERRSGSRRQRSRAGTRYSSSRRSSSRRPASKGGKGGDRYRDRNRRKELTEDNRHRHRDHMEAHRGRRRDREMERRERRSSGDIKTEEMLSQNRGDAGVLRP